MIHNKKFCRRDSLRQLYHGKCLFEKRFSIVNRLYNCNYLIKAPKGQENHYRGIDSPIWFYHKLCHRFFHETPKSFLQIHSRSSVDNHIKKYLCVLCNQEYGRKLQSIKAKKRCRKSSIKMMTKQTALKIKHNHLMTSYRCFKKRYFNSPISNNYKCKAPNGKKDVFRGMHRKMWFYHTKCHHYFRMTPSQLLRKNKVLITCLYCRHIQRINKLFIKHKHHFDYLYHKSLHKFRKRKKLLHNKNYIYYHKKNHQGQLRSNKQFLKEVYAKPDNKNHTYTPEERYKGNMTKILWIYWKNGRGYPFFLRPDDFLNCGTRYPNHIYYKGELASENYFNFYGLARNIDYFHGYIMHNSRIFRHRWHGDFYLPHIIYKNDYNGIIIEYDGCQHFHLIDFSGRYKNAMKHHDKLHALFYKRIMIKKLRFRKKRDRDKDIYCEQHHIHMIRIKHLSKRHNSYGYIKRLVKKVLDKKLLPILYDNYLKDVDMNK